MFFPNALPFEISLAAVVEKSDFFSSVTTVFPVYRFITLVGKGCRLKRPLGTATRFLDLAQKKKNILYRRQKIYLKV